MESLIKLSIIYKIMEKYMPATDVELQLTDTFGTWKDKFNQAIGDINTAIDNLPEFNTLAPTNHASTATTYGVGNANNYGHLKLSDATNSTAGVSSGVAATPAAVKTAYDKASTLATSSAAGIVKPGTGMTVDAAGALKVSFNNTVTSTSTTQAATANAVKTAYDKAVEASNKSGLPLGHIYLWPFSTPPDGSIQLNGSTYSRELYSDLWTLIQTKGWYKPESEWQSIASANGGYCPWYSDGDGSTTFRVPKFAPYQKIALVSGDAGKYYEAGLPNITGTLSAFRHHATNTTSGVFSWTQYGDTFPSYASEGARNGYYTMNAKKASSIYGNSTTVQPESHDWIVCVVAFGTATNVGSVDVANVMSVVGQIQANPHIIETWKSSNGSSWYRKYSDGFIEQGGNSQIDENADKDITLSYPFSSTVYQVIVTNTSGGGRSDTEGYIFVKTKYTSSIKFSASYLNPNTSSFNWYACGY